MTTEKGWLVVAHGRPTSPLRFFVVHVAVYAAIFLLGYWLGSSDLSAPKRAVVLLVAVATTLHVMSVVMPQYVVLRSTENNGINVSGKFREKRIAFGKDTRLADARRCEDGSLALILAGRKDDLTLDRSSFSEHSFEALSQLIAAALDPEPTALIDTCASIGLESRNAKEHLAFLIAEKPNFFTISIVSLGSGVIGLIVAFVLREAIG